MDMKRWIFFLLGLFILGLSQQSFANQPVIYLSKLDMEKAIHGDSRLAYIPLGGKDFRKHYSELNLSVEQRLSFDILKAMLPSYPLAVVTRGKLIFKTDDNCTIVPDHINKVDVSEACRNHDYCYRGLSPFQTDESDQEYFRYCNQQFYNQMIQICKTQQRDCPMSEYYLLWVKSASYPIYGMMKLRELYMIRELLSNLKKYSVAEEFLSKNAFFDLEETRSKYNQFCAWTESRIRRNIKVRKAEKEICKPL